MLKKKIKDFEDYIIYEDGRIFSNKSNKFLKLQKNHEGYIVITLRDNDGKKHHKRLNRLLAIAFLENPLNLPVVNHINHIKDDNSLCNLEWVTVKENADKSVAFQPEKHKARAVITTHDAKIICSYIEQGYRNLEIVKETMFSLDTIKHIRSGKAWTEISKNYKLNSSRNCLSETTVKWICHKINEGLGNRVIVERCTSDINESIVSKIRNGKTFKNISEKILN